MPSESPRSTLKFSAQARSYGLKNADSPNAKATCSSQQQTPKKLAGSQMIYSMLPKYKTPVRKPIKNPFNERLIEVFNKPTCSPDFCSSFVTPQPEPTNKEFFWTVEDLWWLDPAPIESPQTDAEDCLDEETESLAQEAIERYFQESHNILSPIGSPKPIVFNQRVTPDITSHFLADRANSTPCMRHEPKRGIKCVASTQTILSFSTDIPDSIMELLKPFTNVLDESRIDLSTSNSSLSTLRRKLLFNELCDSQCDSDDDNDASKKITSRFLPGDWTPDRVKSTAELFSKSPDISPIAEGILTKPDKSIDFLTTSEQQNEDENMNDTAHHMSVDYYVDAPMESSILQNSLSSGDTGYHTYTSDKSQPSRSTDGSIPFKSTEVTPSENIEQLSIPKLIVDKCSDVNIPDSNLTHSYLGNSSKATDTGITSTPTNKGRNNKHRIAIKSNKPL